MFSVSAAACISVLMPAYNAERYILPSVLSVLAQTFEDFELLVVDDCSTDRTPDILSSIQDRRLRVFRNQANLGIVGSLNRAMAQARGRYIARIDADDYCVPTRFAKQKRYLDQHPDILLVGAGTFILEDGHVRRDHRRADPDPAVLRWQCLISNPIGHPTMMFRADAVAALGTYLREAFRYAEDFDFSHRLLKMGDLAVLPETLVIYRLHQRNLTRTGRDEMVAKTAAVLSGAYEALLGGDRTAEAALAAEHLVAKTPVRSLAVLERLGSLLDQLVAAFLATNSLGEDGAARVVAQAGDLWWETVQGSLRAGLVMPAVLGHGRFRWSRESRPALHRIARSAASGLVRSKVPLSRRQGAGARAGRPTPMTAPVAGPVGDIAGIEDPPSLYVVVDAEAERDPAEPFDQSLAGVGAMAAQERVQAVFDTFGLRPIYALDYAVASQAEGYEPLRGILDRHACVIGARLRPWINPPFEGAAPDRAASGEGLAAALEERKLRALIGAIEENLRVAPLFFKAGRHGHGLPTMETLARLGFAVAFNVPPTADPAVGSSIVSIPMTRAQLGPPWAPLPPRLLARLGLANTVALTPEGVTAGEQVRLIRSLVARGHRTFTLHYHGPSLAPSSAPSSATSSAPSSASGSTRHARTGTEAQAVLQRIEAVCRFFFEELGGLPGNPADLVPQPMRERVWPRPECASPTSLPDAVTAPSGG